MCELDSWQVRSFSSLLSPYSETISAMCVFKVVWEMDFVCGLSDKTTLQDLKSAAARGTSVWLNAPPSNPAQETATLNSY